MSLGIVACAAVAWKGFKISSLAGAERVFI